MTLPAELSVALDDVGSGAATVGVTILLAVVAIFVVKFLAGQFVAGRRVAGLKSLFRR